MNVIKTTKEQNEEYYGQLTIVLAKFFTPVLRHDLIGASVEFIPCMNFLINEGIMKKNSF